MGVSAEVGWEKSLTSVPDGRNLLVLQNIGTNNDEGGPGSREVPFGQVIATRYTGSSNYNALQSKLEKRFTKGLSILSSYTWAHAIDDSPGGICKNGASARDCGPDDPTRPELERGNSDTDVRHRFTFANVWDLPIGRGRRYGTDMPKDLDLAIGDWQFNNIVTMAEWSGLRCHVQWWTRRSHWRSDANSGAGSTGARAESRCLQVRADADLPERSEQSPYRKLSGATSSAAGHSFTGMLHSSRIFRLLRSAKRSRFSSGSPRITC